MSRQSPTSTGSPPTASPAQASSSRPANGYRRPYATTSSRSPSRSRPARRDRRLHRRARSQASCKLQGNPVAKPCPPAEFTTPTSQLPPTQKWEQLNLGTLAVGGQKILGKTPDPSPGDSRRAGVRPAAHAERERRSRSRRSATAARSRRRSASPSPSQTPRQDRRQRPLLPELHHSVDRSSGTSCRMQPSDLEQLDLRHLRNAATGSRPPLRRQSDCTCTASFRAAQAPKGSASASTPTAHHGRTWRSSANGG